MSDVAGEPTVAMWPVEWNADLSTYTRVLADHLGRNGVKIREFGWNSESFRADVVHMHWPDQFFTDSAQPGRQIWSKLLWLAAFRAKGGVLVWTVHNLWPHDRPRHRSRRLRTFLFLLSGVVFLTPGSRELAGREHPALLRKPYAVAPLFAFEGLFQDKPALRVREASGPLQLGTFGFVRPYKNLPALARAAKGLPDVQLRICGPNFGWDDLARELIAIAEDAGNVDVIFKLMAFQELERFVAGCDAIVLPYREIFNSGAAIFALSRMRPVMLPDLGNMAELQRAVGRDWVFLYSGEPTSDIMRSFVAWVGNTNRNTLPDMSSFSAEKSAAATAQLYRSLVRRLR